MRRATPSRGEVALDASSYSPATSTTLCQQLYGSARSCSIYRSRKQRRRNGGICEYAMSSEHTLVIFMNNASLPTSPSHLNQKALVNFPQVLPGLSWRTPRRRATGHHGIQHFAQSGKTTRSSAVSQAACC